MFFGSIKEPKESLCVSVRYKVLSRSFNLHLSIINRSIEGLPKVSLRISLSAFLVLFDMWLSKFHTMGLNSMTQNTIMILEVF